MALQGRCPKCGVRWRWERNYPMGSCRCPVDRYPLERTTHYYRGTVLQTTAAKVAQTAREANERR